MDFIIPELLFPFIISCIIIELTPGPNMAYISVLSATIGRKAGFTLVAGVALGLLAIGLIALLGVTSFIENSKFAYESLKWGGFLYLLWLAWDAWHTKEISVNETNMNFIQRIKFFRRGFIVNILNPKALIFLCLCSTAIHFK